MTSRRLAALSGWAASVLLAGCIAPGGSGGPRGESMSADQFMQTDFNRTVTLEIRDNLASLDTLLDKLYRRNPREWRKSGVADQAAAVARVKRLIEERRPPAGLAGLRDIQVLAVSLDPAYGGDRVAAFVYGLADTLIAAHNDKTRIYLSDVLDGQRIYNAARNVEAAAWLLASRRTAQGEPLLLANEMSAAATNLSFEREFGAIIGRLDLIANLLGETPGASASTTHRACCSSISCQSARLRDIAHSPRRRHRDRSCRHPDRPGHPAGTGPQYAVHAFPHAVRYPRRRNLAEVREPAVHRLVQGRGALNRMLNLTEAESAPPA